MNAAVTGGGGYIGGRLCSALLERGYTVTALDIQFISGEEAGAIKRVKGDIRDKTWLLSVLQEASADVVFHVASFGMSGRDMLNRKMIEEVNIQGTRNVIEACLESGVSRLVYTSTYNVVFGGQEIRNGDSSLPYLQPHQHVDHYSRTKCIAEQAVRAANGREVRDQRRSGSGGTLKTCALRCAGIYGEGEQRHLPRIVSYIERGLFKVTYGSADSLVDFLHADNFCQAHIKAAEAMREEQSPVIGNAYFVSDGAPVNNFLFFKPLVEGLGYSYPTIRVPLSLVFYMAFLIEFVHHYVGQYIYNFQPLLTRAEVYKTGVTHYFNLDEARRDFGYSPEPRNLEGVVKWFRERGCGHGRSSSQLPPRGHDCARTVWSSLLKLLVIGALFALIMSFLPLAS